MDLRAFKQQCTRLVAEAEDDDESNAYREILKHLETNQRIDRNGLCLDLTYKAHDYDRRAGEIRRVQPLSMVADTLQTKARIYREAREMVGGSLV